MFPFPSYQTKKKKNGITFQHIPTDQVDRLRPYGVILANIRDFSLSGSYRIIKGFITLREQAAFATFVNNDSQEDTINRKYSYTTGNRTKTKYIHHKDKINRFLLIKTWKLVNFMPCKQNTSLSEHLFDLISDLGIMLKARSK